MKRMTIARLPLLFMVLATAGCDKISGVRTDAELSQPPNIHCIDQSLRLVAGIGAVFYLTDRSESFQVTPYRGKVITVSHQWQYGPGRRASVQILDDGKQRTYFNGMVKMGEPWPAAELDRFSPLMGRVNLALERQCDLPIAAKGRISRN